MLRVEELMTTGVISLRETDTVQLADHEMRLADIRHLPVVDADQRVVGVVSNRDLLRVLAKRGGGSTRVTEVMSREVVTVRPETPAYTAAELMLDRKIGSLPVVGDGEVLVGIVTETDFLSIARQALHGRTGAELLRA